MENGTSISIYQELFQSLLDFCTRTFEMLIFNGKTSDIYPGQLGTKSRSDPKSRKATMFRKFASFGGSRSREGSSLSSILLEVEQSLKISKKDSKRSLESFWKIKNNERPRFSDSDKNRKWFYGQK